MNKRIVFPLLVASIALILGEQFCQLETISDIRNSNIRSNRRQREEYTGIEKTYSGHVRRLLNNMLDDTGYEKTGEKRKLRKELGLSIDKKSKGNLNCDAYLAKQTVTTAQ